jgi:hypothetical protein
MALLPRPLTAASAGWAASFGQGHADLDGDAWFNMLDCTRLGWRVGTRGARFTRHGGHE